MVAMARARVWCEAGGTEVSTAMVTDGRGVASPLRGERVVGLVPGKRGVAGERVGAGEGARAHGCVRGRRGGHLSGR